MINNVFNNVKINNILIKIINVPLIIINKMKLNHVTIIMRINVIVSLIRYVLLILIVKVKVNILKDVMNNIHINYLLLHQYNVYSNVHIL